MKTLDEVIAEMEDEGLFADVLHYLKDMKNLERDYDILYNKYWREFNQQQTNPALTWDELKQMEGKPVWVESHGDIAEFTGWAIVRNALEDRVYFILSHDDGEFLTYEMALPDVTFGKGWQAYRKERYESN